MPVGKAEPGRIAEKVTIAVAERRAAVLEVIHAARERLLVSIFRCTDFPVLDAVAEALQRGVKVRVLLTPRAKGWETRLKELRAYLESMGAEVRMYADRVVKYHAKYILADHGPAFVGSLNLTEKCFSSTCDFLVVTRDPAVAAGLEELFETDWLAPHSSFPRGLTERLIVGPERARSQFTALLESACKSIHIIDHKVNDISIVSLLKQKKATGVEVKLLGSGDVGGLLSHGKLILVDGRVAAFGSMAMSALNLDFRREVSLMVEDPECVSEFTDFFNLVASGRKVPWATAIAAAQRKMELSRTRPKKKKKKK